MSDKIVESVRAAEKVGTAQYQTFLEYELTDSSKIFYEPIHKNNLPANLERVIWTPFSNIKSPMASSLGR